MYDRRRSTRGDAKAARLRLQTEVEPAWLPGDLEVRIVGESYRADGILAARLSTRPGTSPVAVLLPEPTNPHDPYAVAVYLQGHHVGYLASTVAARVQPALLTSMEANGGRPVACPAEIFEHSVGPQVILLLDPTPLPVDPAAFELVPELAAVLADMISRLDGWTPVLAGVDVDARTALSLAEHARRDAEDDYERGPAAWPRVERSFRDVVARLRRSGDPAVSAAWLGLARSTRYQRGRRDDTLAAYVEALCCDRANTAAWCGLVELASAAPHVATLADVFSRIPFPCRPQPLRQLLGVSYGRDPLGNMRPRQGERLRAVLLDIADSQGDAASVAVLAGDAGLRAEKERDLDAAVASWRRAVAAGSTDAKVADRFSVWLTKQGQYVEAAQVLRLALTEPPISAAVHDRLARRLQRCERNLGRP